MCVMHNITWRTTYELQNRTSIFPLSEERVTVSWISVLTSSLAELQELTIFSFSLCKFFTSSCFFLSCVQRSDSSACCVLAFCWAAWSSDSFFCSSSFNFLIFFCFLMIFSSSNLSFSLLMSRISVNH